MTKVELTRAWSGPYETGDNFILLRAAAGGFEVSISAGAGVDFETTPADTLTLPPSVTYYLRAIGKAAALATVEIEASVSSIDLEELNAAVLAAQTAQIGAETAETGAETARDTAETFAGIPDGNRATSVAGLTDPTTLTLGDNGLVSGSGDPNVDGLYEVQDNSPYEWVRVGDSGLSALGARVNDIDAAMVETAILGRATTVGGGTYLGVGTYALTDVFEFDGTITELRVQCHASNSTTIGIGVGANDGSDHVLDGSFTDIALVAGANTIPVNIAVEAGQALFLSVPTASRVMRTGVDAGTAEGGAYYNTGTAAQTSFSDGSTTDTIQIEIGVTYTRRYVTQQRVQALQTRSDDLSEAFEIAAPRNLYDRTTAQDGKTQNLGSTNVGVFAPRIFLGYLPVEAGKTYTLAIGHWIGLSSSRTFVCLTGQGTGYVGIDHDNGVNTVATNPPEDIIWRGDRSVTLTIPEEATYNYLAIDTGDWTGHSTDDFNSVLDTVIWEEAAEPGLFEPVISDANFARLRSDHLPTNDDWNQVLFPTADLGVLQKLGDNLYWRTRWSDTLDLIEAFTIETSADGSGAYPQFGGAKTVPFDRGNSHDAFNDGTSLSGQADDIGPMNYGGYSGTTDFSYFGGSHGIDDARLVTATGHGKDDADVGSLWTDGNYEFVLARVVDADTLIFLGENLQSSPAFQMAKPVTGGTLTHVSGATNTGAITVGAESETQLTPGAINDALTVFVDGVEITADGYYRGAVMDVRHTLELANPASIYDYLVANVGTAAALELSGDIDPAVLRTVLYRWSAGGGCALHDAITLCQPLQISHRFATQATALAEPSGGYIAAYVPGTDPCPIGGGSYADLAAEYPMTVTTTQDPVVSDDYWTSPSAPPLILAQIAKDGSDVRQHSHTLGFVPDIGDAVGLESICTAVATFKTSSPPATTGEDKAYLIGAAPAFNEATRRFDGAWTPENTVYAATAYRGWTRISDTVTRIEFWAELPDGRGMLVLDYAGAVTRRVVAVPRRWEGKPVTAHEVDGLSVVSGPLVGVGGVTVNSTGAARAVLLVG